MDGSKGRPKMTAGVDLGDKYSYPCASSTHRAARLWRRVCSAHHPGSFQAALLLRAPSAYSHRGWNPLAVGEQGARGVQSGGTCGQCKEAEANLCQQAKDRRDRRLKNLARLARLDPKLLYPLKHRGEESQAHMALIRSREALVSCRTQLINPGYAQRSSPSGPACPSARPEAFTTKRQSTSLRRSCRLLGPSWSRSAR
jgi:transposase